MTLVEMKWVSTIPVRCGRPEDNSEDEDGAFIPTYLLGKHGYVLRAEGNSMEPKIASGSLLIVEGGAAHKDGSLVVVQCGDGIMVKRYERSGRLLSENPDYSPVHFDTNDEARIIAVVKYILTPV
jgi:SOS-response transcriptional repressor LexA